MTCLQILHRALQLNNTKHLRQIQLPATDSVHSLSLCTSVCLLIHRCLCARDVGWCRISTIPLIGFLLCLAASGRRAFSFLGQTNKHYCWSEGQRLVWDRVVTSVSFACVCDPERHKDDGLQKCMGLQKRESK